MTSISGDIVVTEPRRQRQRLCGHCRQPGHDRRRCPDPAMVQRRATESENRRLHLQGVQRHREAARLTQGPDNRIIYKIHNDNPYPIYIYWGNVGGDIVRNMSYIGPESIWGIRASPTHRIITFPATEFSSPPERGDKLKLSESSYFIVGDFNLGEFDVLNNDECIHIHIIKEYVKPKTELELWKECGLKSLFLLKEIERMGGKKNPNLEPMLDMVEDITLPPHTEMDKELAGVPSVFTNLT